MINLNAKISFKKIKINIFAWLKYMYPAVLVLIVIFLIWIMHFLYQNVYKTLAAAEILTELRKTVPEETLQKDKFNEIVEKIKEKSKETATATSTSASKNPFLPLE